jgi:hypothetical protein
LDIPGLRPGIPNFFAIYARLRLEMGILGWLVINFIW